MWFKRVRKRVIGGYNSDVDFGLIKEGNNMIRGFFLE